MSLGYGRVSVAGAGADVSASEFIKRRLDRYLIKTTENTCNRTFVLYSKKIQMNE